MDTAASELDIPPQLDGQQRKWLVVVECVMVALFH